MKKIIFGLVLSCGFIFSSHAMQGMQSAIEHKDWCQVSKIIGNSLSDDDLGSYVNALLSTPCDLNASNQDNKLLLYELLAVAVAHKSKRHNVSYAILQLLKAKKIDPKVPVQGGVFCDILNTDNDFKNYAIILNDLIAQAAKANDLTVSAAPPVAANTGEIGKKAATVEIATRFKVFMACVIGGAICVVVYNWYDSHYKRGDDADIEPEEHLQIQT